MKRIVSRTIIIISAMICIGFLFSILNSFYGNPVSAAIASSKIRSYVEKTYPQLHLEVSKAKYNFKFGEYYSSVKSNSSEDTCFSVTCSNGRINDEYEYEVENRLNTYQRLQQEFDRAIEDILMKEFPYETSIMLADFIKDDGDFSCLTLDMPLDINNPPLKTELTLQILSNEVSYEYLKDRLLEVAAIMENHNIPIDYYSLSLQEAASEGEKAAANGQSLYLYDFPSEKVKEQNLIEVMKEHQKQWEGEQEKK